MEQEPQRADYLVDLAKSPARPGDPASLRRARDILSRMRDSNQLMPQDAPVLDYIERMLRQAGS